MYRWLIVPLAAFFFQSAGAQIHISIPSTSGMQGDTVIVPLTIDDVTGSNVLAYQCVISFDKSVMKIVDIITSGTLSSQGGWTVLPNIFADSIKIGAFGSNPLTGGGTLLKLKVYASSASAGSVSPITFSAALLNAGMPPSIWQNGSLKVNGTGGTTNVIALADSPIPRAYSLAQNYPNPFNPGTTIEFSIPFTSDVTLSVYDVSGICVQTLVSTVLGAGIYRQQWDASGIPSGMYIYRLRAGSYTATKRLLLLK